MPLTKKGKKIMTAMKDEYGEKGEEVFYASANKGTIKGVHGKRKLSKEDVKKYGTLKEISLLEEFGDERGIDDIDDENFFEVPLGDEQDQSFPDEEFSLEDEQEVGTPYSRTFDEDFAEESFENFISNADEETLLKMIATIQDELESR